MKPSVYRQGIIYSLEDIKSIAGQFKFILSRSSPYGLFFLYKQLGNNHLWVGGPFKGKDSNVFLFLGPQKLPKGVGASFSSVIRQNLENDWKRLRESREHNRHELLSYDVKSFRVWAKDFFNFDNQSFKSYFD